MLLLGGHWFGFDPGGIPMDPGKAKEDLELAEAKNPKDLAACIEWSRWW